MKDHEIAELINSVTEIAKKHHDKQCLRELIAQKLVHALRNNVQDFPETHKQGMLEVDSSVKSDPDCDFGLQIAHDGRVWVCINGKAFIRFKPKSRI